MKDPRILKVADILVNYSTKVKKGDVVKIFGGYESKDLILGIYKLVLKKGAYPSVDMSLPGASYNYYKLASDAQLKHFPEIAMHEMKKTDVVISIGSTDNTKELTNIDPKKMSLRQKTTQPLFEERVKKRWVLFEYPVNAFAQDAEMSLEEFEDFVFNATIVDWAKEGKKMQKLANLLNKSDKVRIVGKDTDIELRIKGRHAVAASGEFNMPDGEVFTAPIENSAKGYISFDFPAIYGGREVDGVRLEFKNGKCVKATADKNEKFLIQMLNTDKGARFLGELGIGFNPNLKRFVKNTLFDEKINFTVHLALGRSYDECKGKNKSAIHWDMIKDLRKGGKLIVDGKTIQQNGKWLIKF